MVVGWTKRQVADLALGVGWTKRQVADLALNVGCTGWAGNNVDVERFMQTLEYLGYVVKKSKELPL